ncbi:amidohydrolase family protein, partial [Patescibacteria group bacterium]|nr:amidohydrolase family protein [Patescibacteria group bacterium]
KEIISQDSIVNYGLHFAATKNNLEEIKKVAKQITSVKVFLNQSTGDLKIDDDNVLLKIWEAAPLLTVHAEDDMLEKAIWLVQKTKTPTYFCHVYNQEAIAYLKKYKGKLPIFLEVTPHHLLLTEKQNIDGLFNVKPPLQTEADQQALWQAINERLIDTIGSDHAPHLLSEKQAANPPFGLPGAETTLPLMLNAVNQGQLTLDRLIELMSINPAEIFNITKQDDCYTEVDLEMTKTVSNQNLKTKCGWSPYDGWALTGWPIKTVVNGQTVMENGKINGDIKGREIIYGKI